MTVARRVARQAWRLLLRTVSAGTGGRSDVRNIRAHRPVAISILNVMRYEVSDLQHRR